ncbi:hypothetical protein [Lactococcus fujiensis]|uniref:hypothetical protein n=1 Tax=Lactococcus fujiensis TaxID=610251 RepID=UPI0006D0FAA7|nr:hypothetical protein [Lactococcus fujiensis]
MDDKEIIFKEESYKAKRIVPIPFVESIDYDDKVCKESRIQIMPYLIELMSNFTQSAFSDLVALE